MIAAITAAALVLLLAAALVRLHLGPTLQDRALAASSAAGKAGLVCAALAVAMGRADVLDVAFALAFGGFVLNAAVLKFFRGGAFQAPISPRGEE